MTVYSSYWRRNFSRHAATELGLSLRALRKVAAHLGRNVRPVLWKGMETTEGTAIVLDPEMAKKVYPIPFERFDILVGQVVREGLSSLEWTEWVKARVQREVEDLPEILAPYLEAFVHAAEDIYVDALAKRNVWSLYLSSFWHSQMTRQSRDPRLPPSPRSLADAWKRTEITGNLPDHLHAYYQDPLERMKLCTGAIREVAFLPSPAQRRERRGDLYLETWCSLQKILSEWERFVPSPEAVPLVDEAAPKGTLSRPKRMNRREDEGEQEEDASGLEPDLAEDVKSLVEENETDLTRTILVAVEDPEAGSMRTRVRKGTFRTHVRPDPLLVGKLRGVFTEKESQVRRARRRRVRRGLIEGKLEARRLYRVPINGKVFKNTEPPAAEHSWQICIVADASASMAGKGTPQKPWPIAEKTFASLAEASKGSRNLLDIYAYSEESGGCTLTQLYHGGNLYTVIPAGRTPSGQAIVAAATLIRKRRGRSILIHITDGASNCGVRLSDAVDFCTRNAIEVFTIGCGCSQQTRDFLKACFPTGRLYFMKDTLTLPLALERLLRQRMLFGVPTRWCTAF